jgi:glutaminyl-peptide cyclotransferase
VGLNRRNPVVVRALRRLAATALVVVGPSAAAAQAPVCGYQVVAEHPHDPDAFTQGLIYVDGQLFESTGLYGASTLRRVALTTGEVLQSIDLPSSYFGEGLTMFGDRLFQLTWQEQICFIWHPINFAPQGSFSYTGEGWGLTHDGRLLILSDGTSLLRTFDPMTHAELGSVAVTDGAVAVHLLNELEWIRGEVFANRLLSNRIARIDPDTGNVLAWIDLTGLGPEPQPGPLNGIAWDDVGERLFVTGKNWPSLFEVAMVGCPELRLFGNGFESGDTHRWSETWP